ncbi:O-antigen translocase [Enterobacter hormaechei]|nr:O-antigen translocase [Enterobacter hormaechei]MDV1203238.1 O-antigen translocase [Enterobacter hormaechei]MDV1270729.1 O-antigen translocase [Enterobacter hormaechei]MDV1279836.1 O-antigen translocase [Enterobacter hormaechei]MDV1288871.1 O-antigen translocase [Enterobacter hormaechei]MDV1307696.1 O-antigen translocase [Enterobacter hormaechei]
MASFVVAKIVAIYAGPSGIAMLGQLQNFINSISGVINSSVNSPVVRFTSENYSKGFTECIPWWRGCVRISIIIYCCLVPIIILSSKFISEFLFLESDLYWVVLASLFSLPLTAVGTLVNSVINGQQRYKQYVLLGGISVVISSAIMIAIVIHYSIKGALIAISLQNAAIGIVMLSFAFTQKWFKVKHFIGPVNKEHTKVILGYVSMAIVSALTMPTALLFVRTLLVNRYGWEYAGYWQAVWKVSETYLSVVTISLSIYYLPQLAKLKNIHEIKREINGTIKIVMPIIILMALSVYFLRDFIISVLFTSQFKIARDYFFVQLVGDVIKILSWLYAYSMISRGAFKWFIGTEILSSAGFIVLAYIFIAIYGVHGANIAYALNYTIYLIVVFVNFDRIYKSVENKDRS